MCVYPLLKNIFFFFPFVYNPSVVGSSWRASREEEEEVYQQQQRVLVAFGAGKWPPTPALLLLLLPSSSSVIVLFLFRFFRRKTVGVVFGLSCVSLATDTRIGQEGPSPLHNLDDVDVDCIGLSLFSVWLIRPGEASSCRPIKEI